MFDVGDLPVLTFGNCVLEAAVIKWPVKLYARFYVFFSKSKKRDCLTFFELLHTFSRTLAAIAFVRSHIMTMPSTSMQHTEVIGYSKENLKIHTRPTPLLFLSLPFLSLPSRLSLPLPSFPFSSFLIPSPSLPIPTASFLTSPLLPLPAPFPFP